MERLAKKTSRYSDMDRRKACAEFLLHGNTQIAANNMGLPRTTLVSWQRTDWWPDLLSEVKQELKQELRGIHERMAREAGREALDRINNGDYKLVRTKDDYELKRVPMAGKDLAVITGISTDKIRVDDNLPTSITASDTSQMDRFLAVVNQFKSSLDEKIASSLPGEAIEITDES